MYVKLQMGSITKNGVDDVGQKVKRRRKSENVNVQFMLKLHIK